MARPLRVQHWLRTLGTRVQPPVSADNPYDLFGVSYVHPAPGGDGPIPPIPRVDMFTRFFHGVGAWEFEVEVIWVDGPDGSELVANYGPQPVTFRPTERVRDFVFVLRHVPLPGAGRYRIHLLAIKPRRRLPVATEYFEVVRKP
jgi:hypothetical protein